MTNSPVHANSPVPENSLTSCPYGGNPTVAAKMGTPTCGISRPGNPVDFNDLGKPTAGGRKSRRRGGRKSSRRGGRKSRRGGEEPTVKPTPAVDANQEQKALVNREIECNPGCGQKNILHSIFGTGRPKGVGGGRKSRRGAGHCGAKLKRSTYGGRKSRRGGRKSRR